jgi:hypothetical protein
LHALPSILNRRSPVEIAENIRREYSSAFQRRLDATPSIRIIVKIASLRVGTQLNELLQRVAGINAIPYTAVICVIAYL